MLKQKKYDQIVDKYSIEDLVQCLTFEQGLVVAKYLLHNEQWDSDLQTYAIQLIDKLRFLYPKQWNSNWKHDAFLGYAYLARGWDFDKQYEAYERSVNIAKEPIPEIMMRLAVNWDTPGVYKEKIDEKKAIAILEQVVNQIPYTEAVQSLIGLYEETNQKEKAKSLELVLQNSKKLQLSHHYSYLDFLVEYENSI